MNPAELALIRNEIEISDTYSDTADAILFLGSCLDLLSKIQDAQVKLVVTSPPYNVGKPTSARKNWKSILRSKSRSSMSAYVSCTLKVPSADK